MNAGVSSEQFKQQMIVDFQEELAKLYTDTLKELDECNTFLEVQRRNDYVDYRAILDGILAF